MISDNNYVMPTCVAIQSFINSQKSENLYCIHIVASSLTEENEAIFKNLEVSNISINIIRQNAEEQFHGYHTFDEKSICSASISALLKFILAELFPDLTQILYLDGDLIIRGSLDPILNIKLEDEYAAAVIDSGSIYYKHDFVLKVKNYFNSGVMLLNLEKIRKDNMVSKLCQLKQELNDASLMDQNVFNLVFDGKIKLLPIKYNFMPVSLDRSNSKWKIEQINEIYGTSYQNKKELYLDAVVIHYSSKDKPWKNLDGACASDWLTHYLKTPIKHELITPLEETNDLGISIIMPCYNVENYIEETIKSLLNQTFQNYEIICIDDGSTDNTLSFLRKFEKEHTCIRVISNSNHGQGYERNIGISKAKGKYIYYMDSDDLLAPNCLEKIYRYAEENNLDLLFFEGTSFYESKSLELRFPQYKTAYTRKNAYPRVYTGEELYIHLRQNGDLIVSPCLQLVKRSYLLEKEIKFLELPLLEDNLYVFYVLIRAKRVKCVGDVLFYRRVRENSTMTAARGLERISALSVIIKCTLEEFMKYEKNSPMHLAIATHLRGYFKNVRTAYYELDNEAQKQLDKNLSEPQWLIAALALYFEIEEDSKNEIIEKLHKAWKEKSEINRKLQITYGEKADRGKEIKHLKQELNESTITFSVKISFSFLRKIRRFFSKVKRRLFN